MPSSHRGQYLDEPNYPIPRTWNMPTRRGKEYQTTVRPIHYDRPRSLSEGILDTTPKLPYQRTIPICVTRDTRRSCDCHSGARTMAAKVIWAGYYWSHIHGDCIEYVKMCQKCQEFNPLHHLKPEELHSMTSPWLFAIWGMDIIGPFSPGKGQTKHLLVIGDYLTKWIEAEPLATISAKNVQNFVWKNIVCRFGVPNTIVSNKDRQFIDQGLQTFYDDLGIKSVTSLIKHPQTNGQEEAANKSF